MANYPFTFTLISSTVKSFYSSKRTTETNLSEYLYKSFSNTLNSQQIFLSQILASDWQHSRTNFEINRQKFSKRPICLHHSQRIAMQQVVDNQMETSSVESDLSSKFPNVPVILMSNRSKSTKIKTIRDHTKLNQRN